MKPIRIFRHIDCEGPAHFQTILENRQIPFEMVYIDQGEPVDSNLETTSGLIFMGGSMSVNDSLDWIADEVALIQQAVKQHIPVLGVCLGSQLIAKALGAKVYPGECMEIGWGDIRCNGHSPWTDNLPETMTVFHWHGETFDLPSGAIRLFGNERYANQGFALGPNLALQFHIEMQASAIKEWLERYPEDLARRCDKDHDKQVILENIDNHLGHLQRYADTMFTYWLSHCLS